MTEGSRAADGEQPSGGASESRTLAADSPPEQRRWRASPTMESATRKLRVGVVGCGQIGRMHADAVKSSPVGDLTAVCDVEIGRAQEAAIGTDARCYASLTELLAKSPIDVACVATPDHLHVEPVMEAIAAGCDVFCEKPLALTLEEAVRMKEAAQRAGKQLGVDYNRRFGFGYRMARQLVDRRAIGTITHALLRVTDNVPWFVAARGPYALLTSLLTHHIDLLRWLCGEIVSVHCRMARPHQPSGQHRDIVLSVQFENGALGSLIGGWREGQSRTVELLELGGTAGYLQVDDVQRGIYIHGLDADSVRQLRPNYIRGDDARFYDSLHVHLHAFLFAIAEGDSAPVSAEDGVRGLRVVEAAIESFETALPVAPNREES